MRSVGAKSLICWGTTYSHTCATHSGYRGWTEYIFTLAGGYFILNFDHATCNATSPIQHYIENCNNTNTKMTVVS